MTTIEQAQSVVKDNLYLIFGEEDVDKRNEAIKRLWVDSSEMLFAASEGVFHSHEGLSKCVDAIVAKFKGWKFQHTGALNFLYDHSTEAYTKYGIQVKQGWCPLMVRLIPDL